MLQHRYVATEQLAGFDKYKYSAVDTNPISVYVMQHLWSKAVTIVPVWIAPNTLTFSGFLLLFIYYLILSFYDWHFTASGGSQDSIPSWVWLFCGFATFFAYGLDSIDGKHARRTQCTGPLGELFDHGLDSWAASILILSQFSLFGYAEESPGISVLRMYYVLLIVLITFMLTHWEKYNTGVLFLPWVYDISHLTGTALYLVTAAFGVEIWRRPFVFGYYTADLLTALLFGGSLFLALPQTLYNIFMAYLKKTLKKDSLYEGLLPLFSLFLLFGLLTAWAHLSPVDILAKQPRQFLWLVGVAFSNVICRLIISQMSNTRTEVFHWLLLPLAVVVYAAVTGCLGEAEEFTLSIFAAIVTAAHVHYGVCVVNQLSQHLNIHVFSTTKRTRG